MYKIFNMDNTKLTQRWAVSSFDVIYADYIYGNLDFSWVEPSLILLKERGVFIAQTDHSSVFEFAHYMKKFKMNLVNHLVWKNEWGSHSRSKFHQCFDDILIYSWTKNDYSFYPDKIQVDKATKNKGLNPSGRQTKTATAWIDDICLTTTSKERIKKPDGHLVRWQKPIKLFERIVGPFTKEGDSVFDPFMGVASLGEYCIRNSLFYVGSEIDTEVFSLAEVRLENAMRP